MILHAPRTEFSITNCRFFIFLAVLSTITHAAEIPKFNYIGETPSTVKRPFASPSPSTTKWTLQNVTRLADASEEAAIAYFIQISDSSIPLTARLLARIHHSLNFYAIHFDKKIPAYRVVKVIAAIKQNPAYANVYIMEREPVTYRGVTMVLNNMAAMTHLLQIGEWDYFINLSGSDYPLVSPTVQRKFLAMPYVRERTSNFFILSPQRQWKESLQHRFEHITVDTALGMSERPEDSQLVILEGKTPLASKLNYNFVKGEGWLILTRDACKFMLESPYARKMLLSMAFSQEPSEHFYVSLFWNHPQFNSTIVPHSLRTVYWRINAVDSGQHPYVIDKLRDQNGSYIIWPWLQQSPHWFARKFSEPDNEVMDWIDNEMNGMGQSVNQTSVSESLERVEQHLHWLFSILSEDGNETDNSQPDSNWPSR